MELLSAPIPGESLTREPGNSPWEQPPLFNTVEESLAFYLEKLENDELLEDIFFTLEEGMPVSSLVEAMTSMGVMEGYHTFDVKMLISPVLHEQIVTMAEAAGVSFKEDFEDPAKKAENKKKKRLSAMIEKSLSDPTAPSEEAVEEADEMLGGEEEMSVPEEQLEMPEETTEPVSPVKGLIPRRMNE